MVTRAEQIKLEKVKVFSVRGPNGIIHLAATIQPLGATIVVVKREGEDTYTEHDFRDFKSAKTFVAQRITEAIERGEV